MNRAVRRFGSLARSGAKRASPPTFIEPSLASIRASAPTGPQWQHEVKFDGYRIQFHRTGATTRAYTRRGYDWADRFSSIITALEQLPAKQFVIDGEIIVPDTRGIADFHKLQEDLARKRSDRFVYFAFDLLYLEGYDLRTLPLIERKRRLQELLADAPLAIRFSQHFDVAGHELFKHACDMRLEGIVSKRIDSPYRSGRNDTWLKTKCTKSDSYPIVAFVEKLGARPRRIASLYIGRRDGERLLYAGKVRSGYTDAIARELRERLDPFIRKFSPLSDPVKKPKATWVEPRVLAEVEFSSITAEGLLREAVFKGVRDDLIPPPQPRKRRSRGISVPRENILQLLPDAVVPDQEELKAYWRRVAKEALKYLGRRPLKLVRHVRGTTFYHRGTLPPVSSAVHELKIAKREGGAGTRLWVDDVEGLLGLVDIGVVEVHAWNATVDDIEHADMMVFDFDPGPGIDYDFVIASALAMRELLQSQGLQTWPKLSGGKGIHVMAPLDERMTHDEAHRMAKSLAQRLASVDKRRYTISAALRDRTGRLFIDYLRNGRGTTAVGAYSPRARPNAPLAMPVSWADIERGTRPDAFTLQAELERGTRKPQKARAAKRTR